MVLLDARHFTKLPRLRDTIFNILKLDAKVVVVAVVHLSLSVVKIE